MTTPRISQNLSDAKVYYDLFMAQQNAASQLINKLKISNRSEILDIGCGDGQITAQLAKLVMEGLVIGIDISPEMISFAQKKYETCSNLIFQLLDARQMRFQKKFDLIFSSYSIQWIANKELLLKAIYSHLKSGGALALTAPTDISIQLSQSVESVIGNSVWSLYFKGFKPDWHFLNQTDLEQLVLKHDLKIKLSNYTVEQFIFLSLDSFKRYVLLWFPYLQAIPEDLKKSFFEEVIAAYLQKLPPLAEGHIMLEIPRVDLIAQKSK